MYLIFLSQLWWWLFCWRIPTTCKKYAKKNFISIHKPPASIRFAPLKHALAVTVEPFKFSSRQGGVAYELSYKEIDHRLDRLISSLGIAGQDLLSNHKPIIVNTGNSFLVVPLKDETMVLSARPDFGAIHKISEEFDLIGYYIFSQHTEVPARDVGTRMFAPLYGINEESATGMAAGPLACYLYDKMGINKDVFLIEQGHFMKPPSPSIIAVKLNLEDGKIARLMAG